jgi:hypothetical protein
MGKTWTAEEENLVKKLYPYTTPDELKSIFGGRTIEQIKKKAQYLGVRKTKETRSRIVANGLKKRYSSESWKQKILARRTEKLLKRLERLKQSGRDEKGRFVEGHRSLTRIWSDEEEKLLREVYPIMTLNELRGIFNNKTVQQINSKARALGLKKTKETIGRTVSQSHGGKPRPELKGKKHSKQHREKISAGLKRWYETHDGPWKGKKKPLWLREKMNRILKGKINVGDKNPSKRPEVRAKIAQTLRNGASSFYRFKDHPEWRRRNLESCMKKPSGPERKLIDIIKRHHLPFQYTGNGKIIIGTLNPDFVHNDGEKKVIEVFGRVFHDPEVSFKNEVPWKRQPFGRMAYYAQYGYNCLILWDDELDDEKAVVSKVTSFLERV